MVLFYEIQCHAITTTSEYPPRYGRHFATKNFFLYKDFRDHVVQPSFDFPLYSIVYHQEVIYPKPNKKNSRSF